MAIRIWLLFGHNRAAEERRVKICFFIGHRDAPESVRPLLTEAVERHIIDYGVTEFITGSYGQFDAMAAETVRKAKERHMEVTLTLLIPYYPYPFDASDYDGTYYPAGLETVPRPFAIIRANEHMIRTSDFLICYDAGKIGKTREFVAMARRRERKGLLRITNLA